jgi:tRNA 2-selenouridine synthase
MTDASPSYPTTPLAPLPLAAYALVIDARSPREYAEDHIPGAVNLPVVENDEYAQVGTLYKADLRQAYTVGIGYALHNLAAHIKPLIERYGPQDRFLIYCFRGGKRSQLWANNLRTVGFEVDVVPGGWKRYRAWVRESLETLPGRFTYRVLCGPTNCGKTRLLAALAQAGAQVIDLEGLARHRGSLLGALPGVAQPTQKYFDTLLHDELRRLDPARPVWIEAESKKVGRLQLPDALERAMHASATVYLAPPMAERVRLCREDYAHLAADPLAMVAQLEPLKPLVGGKELELWRGLAAAGRVDDLFERLMVAHYDPAYARSTEYAYGPSDKGLHLAPESLAPEALARLAAELAREDGAPA